jgi:hypothetical protein
MQRRATIASNPPPLHPHNTLPDEEANKRDNHILHPSASVYWQFIQSFIQISHDLDI